MQYHVLNYSYYTDFWNLNTLSYNCWPFICSSLLPIFELCVSAFVVVELCFIHFLYQSLIRYIIRNIFYSVGCLFILLMTFSLCESFLNFSFVVVTFAYFCLCCPCLKRHMQKKIAQTNVKESTAYIFLLNFYGFRPYI